MPLPCELREDFNRFSRHSANCAPLINQVGSASGLFASLLQSSHLLSSVAVAFLVALLEGASDDLMGSASAVP